MPSLMPFSSASTCAFTRLTGPAFIAESRPSSADTSTGRCAASSLPPARGVHLHADRRHESPPRDTRLHAELDALLLGQHLRVHETDRPSVHRGKQAFER